MGNPWWYPLAPSNAGAGTVPNATLPPLSSTVSSVFDQFLKKLEGDSVLNKSALEALREKLHGQKLDHETLRAALFTAEEKPK
jgi:hypothetical protein